MNDYLTEKTWEQPEEKETFDLVDIPLPISASTMNQFIGCPRQWYYRMMGFPTIWTDRSAMNAGTFVHEVIEIYFKMTIDKKLKVNPATIEPRISKVYEEHWAKNPIGGEEDKIEKCIRNFIVMETRRLRYEDHYLPTHVEPYLETPIFKGYPDWYCSDSGILRDWKTDTSNNMDDDKQRQGLIYKSILEYHGLPVKKVIFEMLFSGKSIEIELHELDWLKDQLDKWYSHIKRKYFPKNISWWCQSCPWNLRCFSYPRTLWT